MYENVFSTGATSGLIEGLVDEVAACEVAVRRRIVGWTVCWTVRNVKTKLCFTETMLMQLFC